MGRRPDAARREEVLDGVVAHLAEHGLAGVSLRPVARSLGVSVNGLVHHVGSRDEMVVAALQRAVELQAEVQERWLRREPDLPLPDLLRKWWRWLNASQRNLALVRLGIEAAALDATASGLPGEVRADQVGVWRANIEHRLVAVGMDPDGAAIEASIVKAMFTGLVVDLLATGERRRLTAALDAGLARLEARVAATTVVSRDGGRRRPPAAAASRP